MKHWLSQIELGRWFSNAQYNYRPRNDKERNLMYGCYEEGYNNGYEAGRLKWHDLRENPNDLPKLESKDFSWSITVTNQLGIACHYNYRKRCWETPLATEIEGVIKWCELPKFEE